MGEYDPNRQYMDEEAMGVFEAIDNETASMYGKQVKAVLLANIEYKHRFDRYQSRFNMKEPPSCGRIFAGYLVVRRLGTPMQYETWMPTDVFEEHYQPSTSR